MIIRKMWARKKLILRAVVILVLALGHQDLLLIENLMRSMDWSHRLLG